MITFNEYCQKTFGEKLYKISLNAGFTCPNRDGSKGERGCIFCSEGGSGEFAASSLLSIDEQIEEAKKKVAAKYKGDKYIAYFQAFTNTYAAGSYLEELYSKVLQREDIAAISIATRADCLGKEIINVINRLNKIKPVIVEIGLQSSKAESIKYIRRAYNNDEYVKAIKELNGIGVHTVTHVILGLPFETKEDMVNTVKFAINAGTKGIKLQLLHVLKGTDLAKEYEAGKFEVLTLDEYIDILNDCAKVIPRDMVIHRLTGDGPKNLLIAPKWSADKKKVLNRITKDVKFC